MILVTIEDSNVNIFFIRVPGNAAKILFSRLACFHKYSFIGNRIINAKSNLMTCHACHRILNIFNFCYSCCNINNRIICNHGLVHTVICKQIAFRRPENTSIYSKLITMYCLTIYNPFIFIISYRNLITIN